MTNATTKRRRKRKTSQENSLYWIFKKPEIGKRRVRLYRQEPLAGTDPLAVIWDDAAKFLKAATVAFEAWKKTKDKATKKYIKEAILEGEYDAYPPMRHIAKFAPQRIRDERDAYRARWDRRRRIAIRDLRKTAYGFAPASKSLSTMPT